MTNREKDPSLKPHQSDKAQAAKPGSQSTLSRRNYLAHLATLSSTMVLPSSRADEAPDEASEEPTDTEALNFGFINQPPGQMYSLSSHRLHSWSLGDGNNTVLFEPGLGGSTLEWLPLAEQLSEQSQVFLYDRGGYGWSDPGINPRHVLRLANELKALIEIRTITTPLILVGHSYGGLIMREFARIAGEQVKGLVLVDASHEDQFVRLADKDGVSMLPTSDHFVVSAPELPSGLRRDVHRKILAFSKMRKTYAALHAELSSFKVSCDHIRQQSNRFEFPTIVLSRGLNPSPSQLKSEKREAVWQELQTDLLKLSDQSQQRIATKSGHHIHIDEPQLIVDAVAELTA